MNRKDKRENLVAIAVVCVMMPWSLLPAGPARAETVEAVGDVMVVDATGKTVGKADSGDYETFVSLKASDRLFQVEVTPAGFEAGGVMFESSDCTGAPLLYADDYLIPVAEIGPPGATAYLPEVGATPREVMIRSSRWGGECQEWGSTAPDMVVPAVPLVDLLQVFTPPFHAIAASVADQECCGDCDGNREVKVNELVVSVNHALTGCGTQ